MDPITIALIALSGIGKLGQIAGQKKRQQISPEQLKQMFGAKAITDEQMELFNRAISSAQGQQLMTQAAQQGQQLETDIARRAGESGLGPAGGATSGADVFAGAAGESAAGNLQRSTRASMMEAMLPIAQQLVSDRMQAWLGDRDKVLNQTSRFQDVMGSVGGLSADLLASRQANQVLATATPAGTQPTAPAPGGITTQPKMPGQVPMSPSSAIQTGTPAGTEGAMAVGQPSMGSGIVPGAREKQMRMLMSGGGRFARAMSSRFGAVQPALG
jgi:hypothetical protein